MMRTTGIMHTIRVYQFVCIFIPRDIIRISSAANRSARVGCGPKNDVAVSLCCSFIKYASSSVFPFCTTAGRWLSLQSSQPLGREIISWHLHRHIDLIRKVFYLAISFPVSIIA